MKKTLILIGIILGSIIAHANYNPEYRNVFWLHGVQGDVNYMKALSDYFGSQYKINSYHPSYISNRGFKEAAFQLTGFNIGNKSDDIVIAHSMGGLVARKYYKDYPNKRFGGLVTINTPHLGAQFANSFDNGKINNFFNRISNEGIAGYKVMGSTVGDVNVYHKNLIREAQRFGRAKNAINDYNKSLIKYGILGFYFNNVVGIFQANWLVNYLSTRKIKEEIIPFVKDFSASAMEMASLYVFGANEGPAYANSKDDLKPQSGAIKELTASAITCPTIVIAGETAYPSGLRFLGSTLSYLEQENPGIGDLSDELAINIAKAIATDSRKCESAYSKAYSNGSWLTLGLSNSYYLERRDAFKRQALFWENGFERAYQQCLGSIYYTTETGTYTEWVWVSTGGSGRGAILEPISNPIISEEAIVIDNPSIPSDGSGYWKQVVHTQTYQVEHIHPNDGIVTLPSQKGLEGTDVKYKVLSKINHEDVKRSMKTIYCLNEEFREPRSYFFIK